MIFENLDQLNNININMSGVNLDPRHLDPRYCAVYKTVETGVEMSNFGNKVGLLDQSLYWTVSEMVGSEECSLQLIRSEHIRSGRRLLHFCYHEVHQRDRASKPHHRVARLAPGQADSPPSLSIRSHYKFHGVGKGRPRPILHVLLGRSPLQRRRTPGIAQYIRL